jgi:CPA1 family monovalent cation:H+ antiporter
VTQKRHARTLCARTDGQADIPRAAPIALAKAPPRPRLALTAQTARAETFGLDPSLFELTAVVLGAAAIGCWINARLLRLPAAAGLLVLGLAVSGAMALGDRLWPGLGLAARYDALDRRIDYPGLVLNLMLGFLLFAGAMNVDLSALRRRAGATAVLATVSTVATAGLVAAGFWLVARVAGYDLPWRWALVFGVLISPTDPIAVLAMTKRTALQPELRAQLEGEALFNDGVAVVLFRAALALAISTGAGAVDLPALAGHAVVEAFGGAIIGAVGGALAVLVIRAVDDWATETLATLAAATVVYALGLHLHLSGPIGVVVAGLIVGSPWAERAMSAQTRRYIHPFWHVVDEILNAVLFFGLGLKAWELRAEPGFIVLMLAAPILILGARWIAIFAPSVALPLIGRRAPLKLINALTWAGVRGGLSIAMALSIPPGPARQPILAATFAVVVFSILVQSLTMERLAIRTGFGKPLEDPEPVA